MCAMFDCKGYNTEVVLSTVRDEGTASDHLFVLATY